MNAKSLITLSALALAATASMAADFSLPGQQAAATKSRAEVKAEVLRAHQAGVLIFSTEADAQVALPAAAAATPVANKPQARPSLFKRSEVRADPRPPLVYLGG